MRVLDRYLVRSFLKPLTGAMTAFLSVAVIVDLFERLDTFIDHDVPALTITQYYVATLPYLFVLILPIATLIGAVAQIYVFILIGYVVISWVKADPMNPIVRFIRTVSDPFLERIRRFVPPIAGLDFSALIAILIVQIGVRDFIVATLLDWAQQLR